MSRDPAGLSGWPGPSLQVLRSAKRRELVIGSSYSGARWQAPILIYTKGDPIGLVWKVGDGWRADPHNMADPIILNEASRDEAGRKLLLKATA
jgi:hypothetical protein